MPTKTTYPHHTEKIKWYDIISETKAKESTQCFFDRATEFKFNIKTHMIFFWQILEWTLEIQYSIY